MYILAIDKASLEYDSAAGGQDESYELWQQVLCLNKTTSFCLIKIEKLYEEIPYSCLILLSLILSVFSMNLLKIPFGVKLITPNPFPMFPMFPICSYYVDKGGKNMGYCFMTTEKVKTLGALKSKFKHNYRTILVDNADPELMHLNEELISLPKDENGKQKDYIDFFHDRINELEYYKDHKIRSDQNCAIEVVTTFSRDDEIDIEAWKQKNVEWIQQTFNRAKDNKNNIASIMFHADEPGNVHCHAIIIPIDDRGHLNAKFYTDGSKELRKLQNTYAKSMEEFGLERGLEGGQMKHRQIKKFYADLNRAMVLPDVIPFEVASDYRNRCINEIETLQAAAKRERDQEYQKMKKRLAEERIEQRKIIANEYKRSQKLIHEKMEILNRTQKDFDLREEKIKEKENDIYKIFSMPINEVTEKIKFAEEIQSSLDYIREIDQEKASEYSAFLEQLRNIDTLKKSEKETEYQR